MSLIEEYFRLKDLHEAKSGDRTILIYQVGSFYNMYTTEDNHLVLDIAELLSLRITLTNTNNKINMGSRENPYMAGFPSVAYEKNRDIILNNDYTFVSYKQTKNDP